MKVILSIKANKINGIYLIKNSYDERRLKTLNQVKHYEMRLNKEYNRVLNYCVHSYGLLIEKIDYDKMDFHFIQQFENISFGYFFQLKNISFRSYQPYELKLIYLEKLLQNLIEFAELVNDKKIKVNLNNMLYDIYYKPVEKPVFQITKEKSSIYYHISEII